MPRASKVHFNLCYSNSLFFNYNSPIANSPEPSTKQINQKPHLYKIMWDNIQFIVFSFFKIRRFYFIFFKKISSMGFRTLVKSFILRSDLFSTSACLRHKGESSYESIQCGIFSLILISVFIGLFSIPAIKLLNKEELISTTSIQDFDSSSSYEHKINNIKFAVGIGGLTLSDITTHFDIKLALIDHDKGNSQEVVISLQPCQALHWNGEGQSVKKHIEMLAFDRMLCTPQNFNFTLVGLEGSNHYSELQLKVDRCKNSSNCSKKKDFKDFTADHLNRRDYFRVKLFMLDTVFQLEEHDPIFKILNPNLFISFTDELGSRGEVNLATHEVTTDQSLWPVQNNSVLWGSFVENYETSTIGITSGKYVSISFLKSAKKYESIRKFGKIDQLLAYIGGLFSLIMAVLIFVFGSFNDYRYELMVGERILTFDGWKNHDVKESNMGVFTYIKYSIYEWLLAFGLCPKWQEMEKIYEIREEITQQVDICTIMRKLQYFEYIFETIVEPQILSSANLIRPNTLFQAVKKRKMLQYYYCLHSKQRFSDLQKHFSKPTQHIPLKQAKQTSFHVMANSMKDEQLSHHDEHQEHDRHEQQNQTFCSLSDMFENLKINNLREIRNQKKSKGKLFQSKNAVISQQTIEQIEEQKKGCCEWILQLFDEDIDSEDEEAESKIYQEYLKARENKQFTKSLAKIPCYLNKVIEGNKKHKDYKQTSIKDPSEDKQTSFKDPSEDKQTYVKDHKQ